VVKVSRGLTEEQCELCDKSRKLSISYDRFAKLSKQAIDRGLVSMVAPYWVKDEKHYVIHLLSRGKVYRMSQTEASFYLLGLLEGQGL
jgi:hypothetical protein